ncbi:MAG TPA: chromosome partitioning protein ParB [Eubacterium sp.]|nr:chromosome partitioning protein ParB [Eubacterium sp.]
MAVKKGLGRGLDTLIPKNSKNKTGKEKVSNNSSKDIDNGKETSLNQIKAENKNREVLVDINEIEPNRNQPRKVFDEDAIEELADSIKQYGIIQPLILRKMDNYYEIIAGERRWRAAKKAGLKELPAIIRTYEEDQILKISLIENIQRENLNPIEEAKAYQQLKSEYGLKQDEIASSVSKSRVAVTNILRLLKLDDRVQKMIMENLISSGHGRALLSLENGDEQYQIAARIMDENLSVREAEKLVKVMINNKEESTDKKENEAENSQEKEMMNYFENRIKDILGSKVKIKNKKNNKGKIEIEYYSKDELERIIDMIQSINR